MQSSKAAVGKPWGDYPDRPTTQTMRCLSDLVEDLLRESKVKKQEINNFLFTEFFYLTPGIETHNRDVYSYASAAMLAEALFDVKWQYYKDDVDFDMMSIIEDRRLVSIVPEGMEARMYVSPHEVTTPRKLVVCAGEQLLQGVETNITLMNAYLNGHEDMLRTPKGLERFMRERSQKISSYAGYIGRIGDALDGFKMTTKAGLLHGVDKLFCDPEEFVRSMKANDLGHYWFNLMEAHASLVDLPMIGNAWSYLGSTGEEISALFEMAKSVDACRHLASHDRETKGKKPKRYLVSSGHNVIMPDNPHEMLGLAKAAGEIVMLGEFSRQNCDSNHFLETCKGALHDLGDKLHCHGIPYELAKGIGDYIDQANNGRTLPKEISFEKEARDRHIHRRDGQYIHAVRQLVKETVGISPKPVKYLFHEDDDSIKTTKGIGPIIYRARTVKGKGIEYRGEGWSLEDEDVAMRRAKSLFSEDDVYVRTNQGVHFTFGSTSMGGLINPTTSMIDVRDAFSRISDDHWLNGVTRLHVDAHELVHSAQSNSRIIWRDMATGAAAWGLDLALVMAANGKIDHAYPYDNQLPNDQVNNTWRLSLAQTIEEYALPALAKGKRGEDLRNDGSWENLFAKGKVILKEGRYNHELLQSLPLEESKTAMLVQEAVRSLREGGSYEDLKMHYERLREHELELVSIIEHMAEAYSTVAVEEYLKGTRLHKRTPDEVASMMGRVKEHVKSRGRFGEEYQLAARRATSKRELDELLREKGMRYVKHLSYKDEEIAEENLKKLGYDNLNTHIAYEDMGELERRASKAGMTLGDVLMPMNSARALIGLRYNTQLDTYWQVMGKHGVKRSFKKLLHSESFDDVKALLA